MSRESILIRLASFALGLSPEKAAGNRMVVMLDKSPDGQSNTNLLVMERSQITMDTTKLTFRHPAGETNLPTLVLIATYDDEGVYPVEEGDAEFGTTVEIECPQGTLQMPRAALVEDGRIYYRSDLREEFSQTRLGLLRYVLSRRNPPEKN